jgi:hypothetical protein
MELPRSSDYDSPPSVAHHRAVENWRNVAFPDATVDGYPVTALTGATLNSYLINGFGGDWIDVTSTVAHFPVTITSSGPCTPAATQSLASGADVLKAGD